MLRTNVLPFLQKLAYTCGAGALLPDVELGRSRHDCRRIRAPQHVRNKALFLRPNFACCSMAGCVGTPSGVHRPTAVSANPAQSVTNPFLAESGDGSLIPVGTITMTLPLLRLKSGPLNLSVKRRAAAHRAMAMHALRSNSSLRSRVSRYNEHMQRARQLEGKGGAV